MRHVRNLCQYRSRIRRADSRAELDAELWVGGVYGGQEAGGDVRREPGIAGRSAGGSKDDGMVEESARGVGGVSEGFAVAGGCDAEVCAVGEIAAGEAGVC